MNNPVMARNEAIYRFGNFILTAGDYSLRSGQHEIHLRPKVFEILLYLVERHGHLVRKEELLSSIWLDVIVTENALNKCIEKLRRVLKDDPQHPVFIQTIPRIGFKFIAEVEMIASDSRMDQLSRAGIVSGNRDHINKKKMTRRLQNYLVVLGIIVVSAMAIIGLNFKTANTTGFNSLAVLPFTNLSGDPDQDYLAAGITEGLIANLAKIPSVRVISRTTVTGYSELKSLPEIASELNVDLVIEGSVLRYGDRVRIMARLIEAETDRHLWVQSYERAIQDILKLQHELAYAIASEIKGELNLSAESVVVLPEAYEAYLKGRFYWNKRTPDGLRKGVEYFEQAIKKDHDYALAYVGLADCYNMLSNYDVMPPREAYVKVNSAITQAFSINNELAEAHASLAFTKMFYEWDWEGAEKALQRAIALNPNYVDAHHWYGLLLAMQKRFDDALSEMETALRLDPLSLIVITNTGWVLYYAGRYDEAIVKLQQSLELDPSFVSALVKVGWTYQQMGLLDESIQELQAGLKLVGDDPSLQAILGHAFALAGQNPKTRNILMNLKERTEKEYITPYMVALNYAALGDKEEALRWLQRAYEERDGWMAWINVDPKADPLRTEPQFTDLIQQMGFE